MIALIKYIFNAACLVIESIRFHGLGDSVDERRGIGMFESIQLNKKVL